MSAKKQNNKTTGNLKQRKILIVMGIVLIALIAVLTVLIVKEKKAKQLPNNPAQPVQEEEDGIFPYQLEGGKLEVTSLFQFSGLNPDCGDAEGENMASISVVNKSQEHLESENIQLTLADGTVLTFEIKDIPAGQTVLAFDKNNTTYDTANECVTIEGSGTFVEKTELMEDRVAIDVQGTTITLTNTSQEELSNLVLHCHGLLDESYFGGLTYTYPAPAIAAGETVTVEAVDCYLGGASVVGISQGDGE